ncbi:MAG: efflux RND transporter permease subunit [Pirellulales bacterium]
MKNIVRWAIANAPAMNTLMISVLGLGILSLTMLRREVFPSFDLEIVLVQVPYPGASPEEVEKGICQKIEEAVRSLDGIKKQTSVAKEGSGSVVLELNTDVDPQKILSEVRSAVDRIPSFPLLAEDPVVQQVTRRETGIRVALIGPEEEDELSELQMREMIEQVREDLTQLPEISQANISGAKSYQIDIEIPESTLRKYGLTLGQVAEIIRLENLEMPGGTIRSESQEILVRGNNKREVGQDIAKLPLITQPNGTVLTVADLGIVQDGFADISSYQRVDGRLAMSIAVNRTEKEDIILISDAVHKYVDEKKSELPAGYTIETWGDRSEDVRDRMELLSRNGLQGLFLVVIILAIFLDTRLAFWVSLGIPISILGSCAVLLLLGQTLNMLTMFAFMMALGIVVDDAIVIGENIYAHREQGKNYLQAAIDGTIEVLPSVTMSIATTVIAFMPMFFVSGMMGKFMGVMPVAMISMLIISLLESAFVLPCHLAHGDEEEHGDLITTVLDFFIYPFKKLNVLFVKANQIATKYLGLLIENIYIPTLRYSLSNPLTVVSGAVSLLAISIALVLAGIVTTVFMPKMDSKTVIASVVFSDGTPAYAAEEATLKIEAIAQDMQLQYEQEQGSPVIQIIRRDVGFATSGGHGMQTESSGSHFGTVTARLVTSELRSVTSQEVVSRWRERVQKEVKEIAGVEKLTFASRSMGPGGADVEFKLLAKPEMMDQLEKAVEEAKFKLSEHAGVNDILDDSSPGKWELQHRVKSDALTMGVSTQDLTETVRHSYYGAEVMRLQRGRHEVKLMVRYPKADRHSLADFNQIRVRTGDGSERPITELAEVDFRRPLSEINRVDQKRSITITASVDEAKGNADEIVQQLKEHAIPEVLAEYPGLSVRWEGQEEQRLESLSSLGTGFVVALIAMFILLTLEFRSYFQPLIILAIIPFGFIGAIGGHFIYGIPLTLFSFFGLVALTGVVVNDSIVLIDFINHRLNDGLNVIDALIDTGKRRFRPVMLTSITTVAGLLPLLFESSFQAQVIIPMAISLAFGLMASTVLVLYLVPVLYLLYATFKMPERFGEEGASVETTAALSEGPRPA